MLPTWIGMVLIALGAVLMIRGSVADMFSVVLLCTLMGGAAALTMPALGSSSVPPAQFVLVLICARLLLPGSGQSGDVVAALRANLLLALYTAYGAVMAFAGPRLFAGQVEVVPLRFPGYRYLLQSVPLQPSAQNVTAVIYTAGSFVAGVVAHVAMADERAPVRFVKVGVIVAWLHIFFGVSAALFDGTAYTDLLSLLRNGNYAQLDQDLGSFARLNGIFPEASSYTGFAFIWFVFMFECWYRDVLPRRTGPAAAAMIVTLFFTTSSTAYVSLAGYAVLFVARLFVAPAAVPVRKIVVIGAAALVTLVGACAAAFLLPDFLDDVAYMLRVATVDKQGSESGVQRGFWLRVGWDAFVASHGLGIGPGSSRSSSLVTAMLGAVGVIGTLLFVGHLLRVLKPGRASSYVPQADQRTTIGVAASWAAFSAMIPAAVIAPSSDPGTDFAIFAGVALALRAAGVRPRRSLAPAPDQRLAASFR